MLEPSKKDKNGEKKVSSFQALMISTASRVGSGNIAGIATAIAAGGPSYYMERALGKRWMGVLFSNLLIICFAYGFNGLQAYNMSSALEYYVEDYSNTVWPMVVGSVLAIVTGLIIWGSAPNASAFADVDHPLLLLSGVEGESGVLDGIPYVQEAISSNVGDWGIQFITLSIFAFAFTSVIGNYCYAESNILFIENNKVVLNVFRISCLAAVFLGAQADFSLVWNLADVTMGLMAIVNIIAIFLLSKVALKVLHNYEKQRKEGKNPVFYEEEVGLTGTVWKRNS